MRLPKRTAQHVTETASWKVMQSKLPDHWIVRELTERDYGIDAYIELVTANGEVTGDVCSIRLKGTQSIHWMAMDGETARYAKMSISMSTVNYWWNMPMPVFLVLADTTEERAFFTPVKTQARVRHKVFREEYTFPFHILDDDELGTERGQISFLVQHIRERKYPDFHHLLRGLILHWEDYVSFIREHQGLDVFLGVEADVELKLHHIYESCRFLSQFVDVEWTVRSLKDMYADDKNSFDQKHYRLHNQSMDRILAELEPVFMKVLRGAIDHILGPEIEYWYFNDSVLYTLCIYLKRDSRLANVYL
jgi:hypothetical protein